jgi:sigma-B regulation protein RsbU (phosphoserine phosphatase)
VTRRSQELGTGARRARGHPRGAPDQAAELRRLQHLLEDRDGSIAALTAELEALRDRQERELRTAQRIQVSLMPRSAPDLGPGWEVAARYRAARSIGGDAYDLYPAQPGSVGQLGVNIADVTGKGVTAALLMAFCRAILRSAAWNGTGPADTLQRVNRVLARDVRSGLFVTALVAELDAADGDLRWASAGHEPPLLVRPGGTTSRLPAGGAMLGLFDPADAPEHRRRLRPGETLVLLTDGVTDMTDPHRRRFGEVRLMRTLRGVAGTGASQVLDAVVDALDAFADGTPQADDLTLVAIHRRTGQGDATVTS